MALRGYRCARVANSLPVVWTATMMVRVLGVLRTVRVHVRVQGHRVQPLGDRQSTLHLEAIRSLHNRRHFFCVPPKLSPQSPLAALLRSNGCCLCTTCVRGILCVGITTSWAASID
jgi:hypothetical protein